MALVPDTTVSIHNAAGRLPPGVTVLLDDALQWHCSVCLAELATGLANYDPAAPGWRRVRDAYAELFRAVPDSRVLPLDTEVWLSAGTLAGTLARTQGLQRHQRKELLNDALIYLRPERGQGGLAGADREQGRIRPVAAARQCGRVHPSFIHYAAV